MTPTRWTRLLDLVPDALALPAGERDAFLDRACTAPDGTPEAEFRAEATALVDAAEAAETTGAFTSPVAHGSPTDLPEQIGPWRITGVLGEGGMGVVYAAERVGDGFTQRAALKRVRPGGRADFHARFLRERGLLAGLDHPGIARLLDGGVDDHGAPYLAMERVDGVPITTYADREGLGVEARLGLFLHACTAVAYAHGSLVVHRDLKPAHILVADGGGTTGRPARVTLLDFGIATLADDGADALATQTGGGMLTPQYAAPEQLRGERITTATDVYALGLVLYELLSGVRPYRLAGATPAEAERIVCETDPPPPSAVASPERARALRGDLDVIVMKALAKEPARRYASAEALAADVQRHLEGLPVLARPPTLRYRASRFARRYYGALAVTAGAVLLVAALTAFYTVRLMDERDQQTEATRVARVETARAEAVAGFLEQILRAPNTRWYVEGSAKGPDTPIRAVLDEAAARVDRDFARQPEILADLHHILGDTYLGLGLDAEATRHHRRTLALRESLYTPPHPKLAEALYYASFGARNFPEQFRLLERAVAMQQARNEGNNFPFMAQSLAASYRILGRDSAEAALLDEAFAFVDRTFVPGHDGARYREPMRALLATQRADAALNLADLAGAARWLATADSAIARLPTQTNGLALWHGGQCTHGRLLRLRKRYAEAERHTLACLGERPPRAVAAPFPDAPGATSREFDAELLGTASAEAVALYEAWGRPEAATPYRPAGTRYRARQDSLRQAIRRSGGLD